MEPELAAAIQENESSLSVDCDEENDYAGNGVELEEEEDDTGSTDSEEDRREFGIYACLPVEPGEPDWETEEPLTVEEYLRRVRYEARQLPIVVTAPLPESQQGDGSPRDQQGDQQGPQEQQQQQERQHQTRQDQEVGQRPHYASRYLAADPGIPGCSPQLKPSAAWTLDFLRQFAHLRRRLQREHETLIGQGAGGASGAGISLLGGAGAGAALAADELAALQLDPPSALMPELQQLRGQDQLQVRRQLHAAIRAAVHEAAVTSATAAALYALSARIEKPLHAGTCALYRELLRHCAAQRAALGEAGARSSDPRLPHLNILITIAGAYFGQDEELSTMWDDDVE